MKKLLPILLFSFIFSGAAIVQPDSNDATFNPTDIGFRNGDGFNFPVYSTAIQSDGKIIAVGGLIALMETQKIILPAKQGNRFMQRLVVVK